jgi:hypothetical protein
MKALSFLKEKRDSKLKGRTCTNSRKQRSYKTKAETASPTVHTDSIIFTAIIDATERRIVVVTDVIGAYLNANIDEFLLLNMEGEQVDVLCKIDSKYGDYVTVEKGKKVLYLVLKKALYGCLQSALLWYKIFSITLMEIGFKLNSYDLCVANSIINSK